MRPWAHICTQITKCMFSLGPNAVCFWRVRFSESHAHLLLKKIRKHYKQNVSFWRMILLMFLFLINVSSMWCCTEFQHQFQKFWILYTGRFQDCFSVFWIQLSLVKLLHCVKFAILKEWKTVWNSSRYLHKVTIKRF